MVRQKEHSIVWGGRIYGTPSSFPRCTNYYIKNVIEIKTNFVYGLELFR